MKQGIRFVQLFVAVACSLGLLSCKKQVPASQEIDFGVVKDSVYRNDYFGFQLTVPAGWHLPPREENEQMMQQGGKLIAGDDRTMKAQLKAAELDTVPLLSAFEQPPGSPIPFNSNLICMAERLPKGVVLKDAAEYLRHTKDILQKGAMDIRVVGEKANESLNGVPCATMETITTLGPMKVRQKYHAVLSKGYALGFIVTAKDGDTEKEAVLQSALATLKWDK